jgi:hypothetical protein
MNINYAPLLVLAFFMFTLGGILFLKKGFHWKSASLMAIAVLLGLLTKGTGIVLLGGLLILVCYQAGKGIKNARNKLRYIAPSFLIIIIFLSFFFLKYDLATIVSFKNINSPSGLVLSLGEYLSKANSPFSISKNYWGDLSWTRDNIDKYLIYVIWLAEFFSVIGLGFYFFSENKPDFLPEKKYAAFLLLMIVILQVSIRFYDWKTYSDYDALILGTPGRYFLPNLASHLILVFIGIGMFFKKEKYLNYSLIAMLILMSVFSLYQIFNIILPRFYL